MSIIVLFCADPLAPRHPDPMYEAEVVACDALGIDYAAFSYETLVNEQQPAQAVRRIPIQEPARLGVYRGWMLRPALYAQLFDALQTRGITLINPPDAYTHAHHLPASYPVIADHTPESVWLPVDPARPLAALLDDIMPLLARFGASPLILKDYVKSQKHYWHEACYIPSAADRAAVERVVARFLELQGDDLNEGLVFRRFVELEPLATHSQSGMPLTTEFRVFVLDGEPLLVTEYWEEGDYHARSLPVEQFTSVMRAVQSRFYTMDVAQKRAGDWMITELGDAQVAGLPERADPHAFYAALQTRLR